MVTSATPVTETKTSLHSWLTSKVSLLAEVDRTERRKGTKFTKCSQMSRKSVKRERDFPDCLLNQAKTGERAGGKKLPCKWTPPPPSEVVLSMIWNVWPKNKN